MLRRVVCAVVALCSVSAVLIPSALAAGAASHAKPKPKPAPTRVIREALLPPGAWREGSTYGPWNVVFTGYGSVSSTPSRQAVRLAPTAATAPERTHASLAVTNASVGNFDASLAMKTTAQLRTGSAPNPWERAWALWHYTDTTHFYYVVLKTNGWEIGKADPAYPGAQRFLATGTDTAFALGATHKVAIAQRGATFTVKVDGRALATFTDTERPYLRGALGLYTEDADVTFGSVVVRSR